MRSLFKRFLHWYLVQISWRMRRFFPGLPILMWRYLWGSSKEMRIRVHGLFTKPKLDRSWFSKRFSDLIDQQIRAEISIPSSAGGQINILSVTISPDNDIVAFGTKLSGRWRFLDHLELKGGKIYTETIGIRLSEDFRVESFSTVKGTETTNELGIWTDVRATRKPEGYWLTHARGGRPVEPSLNRISAIPLDKSFRVSGPEKIFSSPTNNVRERNWTPIDTGSCGTPKYLYFPAADESGSSEEAALTPLRALKSPISSRLAGGTPLVEIENYGWFCIAHERLTSPIRHYLHYVLGYTRSENGFEMTSVSDSFYFETPLGNEFCTGLVRRDDELLISNQAGNRAFIYSIPIHEFVETFCAQ